MVYRSRSGRYHIWINDYMSPKAKRRTVVHELAHIFKDSPRVPYLVGIDMRREEIELTAEAVAVSLNPNPDERRLGYEMSKLRH
jgi:Zn-dependent peptidase ImmA (M78 family)